MKVFGTYVSYQLLLLLVAIGWIAVGGMHFEPSLLGAAVVGAGVCLAREWAGGWGETSIGESTLWLVAGGGVLCIVLIASDDLGSGWPWKISMLSAGSIGLGLAQMTISSVRRTRSRRST